jgi:hypothetical protein
LVVVNVLYAVAQMPCPDEKTRSTFRSTKNVVSSLLDHHSDVVASGELYRGNNVVLSGSIDSIERLATESAGAWLLSTRGIDGRTSDVDWIAQANGIGGLEDSIAPTFVNKLAFVCILLGTRVAGRSDGVGG